MATCELSIKSDGDEVLTSIDGSGSDLVTAIATVLTENLDIRNLVTIALMVVAKNELNNKGESDEQRTIN